MEVSKERVIWEAKCPKCGENGFIPELTAHPRSKSVSRWCSNCECWMDCTPVVYNGPALTPMVPNKHHILCNGQTGPIIGCRWCCFQDANGEWKGLWLSNLGPSGIA